MVTRSFPEVTIEFPPFPNTTLASVSFPNDFLCCEVRVHDYTCNNDMVRLNHIHHKYRFVISTSMLLQSDHTANSFFYDKISSMGVTVGDSIYNDLRILSRDLIINNRVGGPGTDLPLVVLEVKIVNVEGLEAESGIEEWMLDAIEAMEESMENDVGSQLVPTSQSSLNALEKVIIDRSCSVDQCTVCLEKFFDGELVTSMPCAHVYHGDCIVQWLRRSHFCPLCRFEMTT